MTGDHRRTWLLAALILLVLAGHLPFLASTLEDLDSFNFALGLHDFDPRTHQPHPPGYPVIVGMGRAARLVTGAFASGPEADARALAAVSAIAGAILVVPLFVLYGHLERLRTAPRTESRGDVVFAATRAGHRRTAHLVRDVATDERHSRSRRSASRLAVSTTGRSTPRGTWGARGPGRWCGTSSRSGQAGLPAKGGRSRRTGRRRQP